MILKLECLFYQNIYTFFFILFYIRNAILTQTNPKKDLIGKKTCQLKMYKNKKKWLLFKDDIFPCCLFAELNKCLSFLSQLFWHLTNTYSALFIRLWFDSGFSTENPNESHGHDGLPASLWTRADGAEWPRWVAAGGGVRERAPTCQDWSGCGAEWRGRQLWPAGNYRTNFCLNWFIWCGRNVCDVFAQRCVIAITNG